jgi:hypothetical protein
VSVLIAHLTDLHIQTAEDPVLGRDEVVGRAIASEVAADTRVVVLAIGGDSAFAGKVPQFEHAAAFYTAIKAKVEAERPTVQVEFVVIAGNHDCDFGDDDETRRTPAATDAPEPALALANFFAFEQRLGVKYQPHTAASPHFAWCDIRDNDSVLRILLINTSVESRLREQPGSLSLPIDGLLPNLIPQAQYVLALLHHPWNWFKQPEIMRPLRDRLEELSDVILTGHEHAAETVELIRDNVTASLYVFGRRASRECFPQRIIVRDP